MPQRKITIQILISFKFSLTFNGLIFPPPEINRQLISPPAAHFCKTFKILTKFRRAKNKGAKKHIGSLHVKTHPLFR
jgi:hypothetical protein